MMTFKSFQWKTSTFFYFENETETWWALFSFLQVLKMKTSPKRVLEKYSSSHWTKKTFDDFSSSLSSLPKQTVFITTSNLKDFLTNVQAKKAILNSQEFSELLALIHQPTGQIVTKAPLKKRTRQQVEPQILEISEQEKILLDFVQESVELANFVQQFIQSEKPISDFDWKRLTTGVDLLNQAVKELKTTTSSDTNSNDLNVIDVFYVE